MEMKKNNKGFSLVELIIVIAIMAVLMAVLAPQFLRYVERSRLQSDNTAIGEIANACKVAATNEDVTADLATGAITITIPGNAAVTCTPASADLSAELDATLGTDVTLTSNQYTTAAPSIVVSINANNVVEVRVVGYVEEVGDTPSVAPGTLF